MLYQLIFQYLNHDQKILFIPHLSVDSHLRLFPKPAKGQLGNPTSAHRFFRGFHQSGHEAF
jgi:hypothetical protein